MDQRTFERTIDFPKRCTGSLSALSESSGLWCWPDCPSAGAGGDTGVGSSCFLEWSFVHEALPQDPVVLFSSLLWSMFSIQMSQVDCVTRKVKCGMEKRKKMGDYFVKPGVILTPLFITFGTVRLNLTKLGLFLPSKIKFIIFQATSFDVGALILIVEDGTDSGNDMCQNP